MVRGQRGRARRRCQRAQVYSSLRSSGPIYVCVALLVRFSRRRGRARPSSLGELATVFDVSVGMSAGLSALVDGYNYTLQNL